MEIALKFNDSGFGTLVYVQNETFGYAFGTEKEIEDKVDEIHATKIPVSFMDIYDRELDKAELKIIKDHVIGLTTDKHR